MPEAMKKMLTNRSRLLAAAHQARGKCAQPLVDSVARGADFCGVDNHEGVEVGVGGVRPPRERACVE